MIKKLLIVLLLGLLLVACQESDEDNSSHDAADSNANSEETNNSEDESSNEGSEETGSSSDSEDSEELKPVDDEEEGSSEETIEKVNLLDSTKTVQHPEQDITFNFKEAYFTMEFTPTGDNPSDSRSVIATDKEIYFHVIGTIENNTKDAFSFGNVLLDGKVFLIYNDEHEFETTASTENSEGTEFEGSRAEPLTETTIHYYKKVPIAVYENDAPLNMKFSLSEEEYEIELR